MAALREKGLQDGEEVLQETPSEPVNVAQTPRVHEEGVLVCMEGPQFSTRAEAKLYRSWGGSVINMSCLPEAKLAREAEVGYAMVCMSTDYDCWRKETEGGDVSVEMVMANMAANAENARRVAAAVLDVLGRGADGGGGEGKEMEGALDLKKVKRVVNGDKWKGQSRGGLTGMSTDSAVKKEAKGRLKWLFEDWKS